MDEDRARLGLLISALGSALLGVSVFLPWYAVTVTSSGAAAAQQALGSAAAQYGNAGLQAEVNSLGAVFGTFAGRQLATVSAHQVLSYISPILLLLAGISLLASLLRLAEISRPSRGAAVRSPSSARRQRCACSSVWWSAPANSKTSSPSR